MEDVHATLVRCLHRLHFSSFLLDLFFLFSFFLFSVSGGCWFVPLAFVPFFILFLLILSCLFIYVYLFCIRCLYMFTVIPFVMVPVDSYNKTVLSSERIVASRFVYVSGYKNTSA